MLPKSTAAGRQLAYRSLSERLSASLSKTACGNSLVADDFVRARPSKRLMGGVTAWAGATPVWAHVPWPNLSVRAFARPEVAPAHAAIYSPGNDPAKGD